MISPWVGVCKPSTLSYTRSMADGNENRLWSIDTKEDRGGIPLWPVFLILLLGAFVIGGLSVPCMGLRMDYLRHAPENSPMDFWQMQCAKEQGACVCRQETSGITGGPRCEFSGDLMVRCQRVSADEGRPRSADE